MRLSGIPLGEDMSKTEAGIQHLLHLPVFYLLLGAIIFCYVVEKYLGLYDVSGASRVMKARDPKVSFSVTRRSIRGILAEKTFAAVQGVIKLIRILAIIGLLLAAWFSITA